MATNWKRRSRADVAIFGALLAAAGVGLLMVVDALSDLASLLLTQ